MLINPPSSLVQYKRVATRARKEQGGHGRRYIKKIETGCDPSLMSTSVEYGLAVDDFFALDSTSGITRVHHQLRVIHNLLVIVVGVVSNDQYAVVLSQVVERRARHLEIVLATTPNKWQVRVIIAYFRPRFPEQLNDRQCRRF